MVREATESTPEGVPGSSPGACPREQEARCRTNPNSVKGKELGDRIDPALLQSFYQRARTDPWRQGPRLVS